MNVLAYRLVQGTTLLGRSCCPHCAQKIAFYDLIPLISWLLLGGKCRRCKKPISWLYPAIELLTALLLSSALLFLPFEYFPAYFIIFSALIITIRSDLETMLISRFATVFLIPIIVILSFFDLVPISPLQSILGALFGYFLLYGLAIIFKKLTGKEGIGEGDNELLAFIGSFLGIAGAWATLSLGAISGSIAGLMYMAYAKPTHELRLPFGPFLALGALIVIFAKSLVMQILFGAYSL